MGDLQTDVSLLSIAGLGAFSKVLGVLSSDDVQPMATIQLAQLGSIFPISGTAAKKVPDLLTRVVSHKVGRLAIMAGWRRGDTSSLMAQSAGGQAVSLLAFCLNNMYVDSAVGTTLYELCHLLLPQSFHIASPAQLAGAARVLGDKLNTLGFGNLLAKQAVRVSSVYKELDVDQPSDLFESPATESIVELFKAVSHLGEDDSVITISGSTAMVHILTILLFMFPEDVIASVETYVIHQGLRPKLVVDIVRTVSTSVQVSSTLDKTPSFRLPISACAIKSPVAGLCSFEWKGWLARKLEFQLAAIGVVCTEELRIVCCDMLVQLAYIDPRKTLGMSHVLPPIGIAALLGPFHRSRIQNVCETLLLATPSQLDANLTTETGPDFLGVVQDLTGVKCVCQDQNPHSTWWTGKFVATHLPCPWYDLWNRIRSVVNVGVRCLLIQTTGEVSVPGQLVSSTWETYMGPIDRNSNIPYLQSVLSLISGAETVKGCIGVSSSGCTLYPSILESMEVGREQAFSFELVDGVLVYQDLYYKVLRSEGEPREAAETSLVDSRTPITPSSFGDFSNMLLTIRHGWKELVLECAVQVSGRYIRIQLAPVLTTYMSLRRTERCEHDYDIPLDEALRNKRPLMVTGVASPKAFKERTTALAMVRYNPVAQLLCCEAGTACLLVQKCCLNCAVKQAGGDYDILIVSS